MTVYGMMHKGEYWLSAWKNNLCKKFFSFFHKHIFWKENHQGQRAFSVKCGENTYIFNVLQK